ncbi:hypothetical protein LWI29_033477 [Acer saccharum]|uniref:Uncharacterized protein n=1 Tax=Acer saccharum TaxID=4024 RepID=A0AA39VUM7_ACESA|nr:hypothetical protein LWI29_033477 [Acer saccharum]
MPLQYMHDSPISLHSMALVALECGTVDHCADGAILQVEAKKKISECVALLRRVGKGHGKLNLKESLQAIEDDQREYSLDEEDVEAQSVILKPDRSKKDANILENSLSRKYPEMGFYEALQEEKEKLHIELQRSRTNKDVKQCQVIEHLIHVTENVVNELPGKNVKKLVVNEPAYVISGYVTNANSGYGELGLKHEEQVQSQWQTDLFDCCEEPCLSKFQYIMIHYSDFQDRDYVML